MAKKHWFILFSCIVLLAGPPIAWGGYVAYQYTIAEPRRVEAKRQFILHSADHQRIVDESRLMLATPSAYPHASGAAYPSPLPPYLASLDATSIDVLPDGVFIHFDREYSLWVSPPGSTTPPPGIGAGARELIPGLWYFEYP